MCITLLDHNFSYLLHLLDFCLLQYLLCSDKKQWHFIKCQSYIHHSLRHITNARFLFTAIFVVFWSKAMTLYKVSKLHTSFFKTFYKKTRAFYLIYVKDTPLGFALLYRYYPLTWRMLWLKHYCCYCSFFYFHFIFWWIVNF